MQSVISMKIKQKHGSNLKIEIERISEYIRIKILLRTNIRLYSYPKSWHKQISEYIHFQKIIRTNIRINNWIKNIQKFKYSNTFVTL